MKKIIITLFITALIAGLYTDSSAIPAFARKYNMSCNVCHSPFPKLKPYGEDFAANGFQLPDKEPSRFFKNTGDELLTLMREIPVALRFELYGQYENARDVNPDFRSPYILKLLSGGNIYKDISYYFYFFFSERGSIAGIEDAFVMFNNVLSKKIDMDLYAGQFQVSDPLFKRELRTELEDYKIYATTPGRSMANLKYDRGLMLTYGAPTKTDFTLEVINGSGIDTKDVFDVDKYKNAMFRVSQEMTPFLRIGGFGYYGKEQLDSVSNELYMAGADLTLGNDKVELNAQYVYRSDINPGMTGIKPSERVKTNGGFVELIVSPKGDKSRVTGSLLYNYVDSDFKELNYQSYTGTLNYLLARNVRLVGEYTYVKDTKTSKVSLGIISAF
ncbi:MAG TPA: hypothetical protein VN514_07305 [Ignavibacteria bacterium]|nr:hypothetical protein [Ignavibacteria bacterium]